MNNWALKDNNGQRHTAKRQMWFILSGAIVHAKPVNDWLN